MTESIAENLRRAAERAAVVGETPEDVLAAAEAVAARDVSHLIPAEWFTRFAYVVRVDGFFDIARRTLMPRKAFDALYRHVKTNSLHDGKLISASKAYDESRAAMGGAFLKGVTYAPGSGPLCEWEGEAFGNLWTDCRPEPVAGDVTLWLEHAARMIPDEAERNHVLDVLAYKLQNPARKINHGILHAGIPGSGKDTLYSPFFWALGGPEHRNIAVVRNEDLMTAFNYSIESEVMVVNELRQGPHRDVRALENFLKPILAAPPEFLPVNKKMEHPYLSLNRSLVLAFSNEKKAIVLPADDRRWFVLWSTADRLPEPEACRLWDWYDAGGKAHVAAFLRTRDVSRFNPARPPMMTPAKKHLLRANDHDVEHELFLLVHERRGPFQHGVIASPWGIVCSQCEAAIKRGAISISQLQTALQAADWADRGRITARGLTRRHTYTAPGVMDRLTDTELAHAVNRTFPPALRAVQ